MQTTYTKITFAEWMLNSFRPTYATCCYEMHLMNRGGINCIKTECQAYVAEIQLKLLYMLFTSTQEVWPVLKSSDIYMNGKKLWTVEHSWMGILLLTQQVPFYQTGSVWSMDQGATRERFVGYHIVPTATEFWDMWEGQTFPHGTFL